MRIITFTPVGKRLEPETEETLSRQTVRTDRYIVQENNHSIDTIKCWRNVQKAYENMRTLIISNKYDAVFICEADIITPPDAIEKLMEIDAPVVGGLYAFRGGVPLPNVFRAASVWDAKNLMKWEEIQAQWGEVIQCSGISMGCVFIRQEVLQDFSFLLTESVPPDNALMQYCVQNGFKQMARLDVICGHKANKSIIWPDKIFGYWYN